jgi:cysteinyl-tRNA synthetase
MNAYWAAAAGQHGNAEINASVAGFVEQILSLLGFQLSGAVQTSSVDDPTASQLLDVLTQFRSFVRRLAIGQVKTLKAGRAPNDQIEPFKQILQQCDTMRDQHLKEIGVTLQDRGEESSWSIARTKSNK